MPEKSRSAKKALVLSLCLSDLRHEWLLTVCMVMAVASVLGPLLILFGLKFGTVETLRGRLIRDPRNCEIRPVSSHSFSGQWFTQIHERPDVAFVIPTTRQLATSVELAKAGDKNKGVSVDAIPTAPGDPLILENGASVPGMGEALLSDAAAESLAARAGDTLVLTVRRIKGGGFETGTVQVTVTGVLPVRAGATKAVFVPLPMLEAMENFKDGMGVPAFGWAGDLPRAYPAFTSLLAYCPSRLGPELEFKLTSNTGFSARSSISAEEAGALTGASDPDEPESGAWYLLSTKGSPATEQNIAALRNALAGQNARLYPLAGDLRMSLAGPDGKALGSFAVRPATPFGSVGGTGLKNASPWLENFSQKTLPTIQWLQVLAPPSLNASGEAEATVIAGDNALRFPVRLVPFTGAADGTVKLPLRLLGVLGLFQSRPLVWDDVSREFLLAKRGYAGFRLYAAGLENVAPLKQYFEEQGFTVNTEAERIDDVLRLDTYLSLIFWLIAAGSLVGGAACLVSNIYAGIERKRRELAVLRLLGLSGGAFLRFPLYTAGFFAVCGFGVALLLFLSMALVINGLFGSHLQPGESLCTLAWWHPLAALALTLCIALIAGGIAAGRAGKVDPAEALRDE